ncbi:unnamed protein product [Discula destructiva]
MIRSLRTAPLWRQPLATATTPTTTSSPLQRLAAEAWRNSARSRTTTARGTQSAAGKKTTGRLAGWSASAPILRGPSTWRSTLSGSADTLLARTQKRNFNWTWSRRSQAEGAKAEESLSLSGRLKKLSREYGWSAVGVYLGLSVLDFPFCFLLVKWAGTERIATIEEWVVSHVQQIIPESAQQQWHDWRGAMKGAEKDEVGDNHISEDIEKVGWGVEKAQQAHKADASLATQLALAYAIHKSFIFVRVPLTAAVTPKVVKVLRSWGWQIGKRKPKKLNKARKSSKSEP